MKIKVTIEDITVEVDRPNFIDYSRTTDNSDVRTNIMNDTVLPLLKEVVESAKTLYQERTKNNI